MMSLEKTFFSDNGDSQENGLGCWLKLHSSDGIPRDVGWPCDCAHCHLGAQLRLNICFDRPDHCCGHATSYDDGVAVSTWGATPRCRSPHESESLNLETQSNSAPTGWWIRPGTDYLSEPLFA